MYRKTVEINGLSDREKLKLREEEEFYRKEREFDGLDEDANDYNVNVRRRRRKVRGTGTYRKARTNPFSKVVSQSKRGYHDDFDEDYDDTLYEERMVDEAGYPVFPNNTKPDYYLSEDEIRERDGIEETDNSHEIPFSGNYGNTPVTEDEVESSSSVNDYSDNDFGDHFSDSGGDSDDSDD